MNLVDNTKQMTNDWHPADIKAALEKNGYSFSKIAAENGYKSRAISKVLRSPWSSIETIVGKILNLHPMEIWPSRYDSHGQPYRSRVKATVPKRNKGRNG